MQRSCASLMPDTADTPASLVTPLQRAPPRPVVVPPNHVNPVCRQHTWHCHTVPPTIPPRPRRPPTRYATLSATRHANSRASRVRLPRFQLTHIFPPIKILFHTFFMRYAVHKRGLCRRAVSVCLSVTFVYSVETNKCIFKIFHHRVATPF